MRPADPSQRPMFDAPTLARLEPAPVPAPGPKPDPRQLDAWAVLPGESTADYLARTARLIYPAVTP